MNELEFQEEWLSAYLDDELTEEQRQVVEQRLAIDPAAQATFEDLQRVRSMVAKLPSWSGPDLKFSVPVGAPGSFAEADDEADDELEHEPSEHEPRQNAPSANEPSELDDFEDVPRVVGGANEPRPTFHNAHSRGDFNARSLRPLLAWGAVAATVLLVAGLGSVYFGPSNMPSVAHQEAPPTMAANGPAELRPGGDVPDSLVADNAIEGNVLESAGLAPRELGDSAMAFDAPAIGDQSGSRLSEPSDPARAAKRSEPQAGGLAFQEEPQALSNVADTKLKTDESRTANSPLPAPPGAALGGLGGIAGPAPSDVAMNSALTDPTADELPPPAPLRAGEVESAEAMRAPSQDGLADKVQAAGQSVQSGNTFYYARSQSWSADETLSRLLSAAPLSQSNQLAYGSDGMQRGALQNQVEVANESVLMAAIKAEVANSPDFFENIVTSNRLVEVDQSPLLNQYALGNTAAGNTAAGNTAAGNRAAGNVAQGNVAMADTTQTTDPTNANAPGNSAAGNMASNAVGSNSAANNAYSIQSQTLTQNALGLNRYAVPRYQSTQSNQPQGNSIVLFLTRDEANQILNQLQEKGQVTSQVWKIDRQAAPPMAQGGEFNNAALAAPNSTPRGVAEPASQANQANPKMESSIQEKVILLLNAPPN